MKFKSLTKIFLFVAVTALFSCGSSEDNGDGDGGNNGPTSITVTASSLFVDYGDSVSFTVKTNAGTDVTSNATVLVNNQAITGDTYTATETGAYAITATYEGLTSSSINVTVLPVIVSIEIQTAQTTYNLGDRVEYEVLAFDNDGTSIPVTSAAEFYVNGSVSITGSNVVPSETGSMDTYATFNDFTTETISVTIEDNASTPGTFAKNAVIEDFTGTWCGWCPRVSYGIELVKEASDRVAVVAVHSGDVMATSVGNTLIGQFNPSGSYPTAFLNRTVEWTYPEPSNVTQVTSTAQGNVSTGLSISTAVKENNLSFVVNAGFGQNTAGAKLVILLLENGLIYDQENYTNYYGGGAVLQDFVHDHVLRHSFTNILGDVIPGSDTQANTTYRKHVDYVIPANYNAFKLEIVAMVVGSNNQVLNVRKVNVGEKVSFN